MVPFLQVFLPHESSFLDFLLSERGLRAGARTCSLKTKRKGLLLTEELVLLKKEKKFWKRKYSSW